MGARGLPCAVFGVGYVSIMTRFSCPSVFEQREKKPLVPRVTVV